MKSLQVLPGSQHPESKLTESQVREIWRRILAAEESMAAIGRAFGVSPSTIYGIKSRRYWRHVEVGS